MPVKKTHFLSRSFSCLQQEGSAQLRHGFDDQDTGHDRKSWKMAGEKGLVDGHILEAGDF